MWCRVCVSLFVQLCVCVSSKSQSNSRYGGSGRRLSLLLSYFINTAEIQTTDTHRGRTRVPHTGNVSAPSLLRFSARLSLFCSQTTCIWSFYVTPETELRPMYRLVFGLLERRPPTSGRIEILSWPQSCKNGLFSFSRHAGYLLILHL